MESTLSHEDLDVLSLIEEKGVAGYGLLKVLEHYCNEFVDGRVPLAYLPLIAKLVNASLDLIVELIDKYQFFRKDEEEHVFYMTPNCGELACKLIERNKCRKAGQKSAEKRSAKKLAKALPVQKTAAERSAGEVVGEVAGDVAGDVEDVVEKVVQRDKSPDSLTTTTTSKKKTKNGSGAAALPAAATLSEAAPLPGGEGFPTATWRELLDRVLEDELCLEICGMQYGNAREWKENLPLIKQFFRNHVGIYKDLNAKARYEEAKKYLRNCVKHGGPVWEMVQEQLRSKSQDDPYRFEQRDPDTGERFCYGVPIPDEAPPRPNDNVFWNVEKGAWL